MGGDVFTAGSDTFLTCVSKCFSLCARAESCRVRMHELKIRPSLNSVLPFKSAGKLWESHKGDGLNP